MQVVTKYEERIDVKSRGKKESYEEFDLLIGSINSIITITKESIINEVYSDNASLNNYIHSFTHSIVHYSGSGKKGLEVCYYTDTKNNNKVIDLSGIGSMVMKNASTLVTPEGVILMYKNNVIIATLDCYTEKYIMIEQIDKKAVIIDRIVIENDNVYVEYMTKEKSICKKQLMFNFDFTSKNAPSSAVEILIK